jgi:hypothetical protein
MADMAGRKLSLLLDFVKFVILSGASACALSASARVVEGPHACLYSHRLHRGSLKQQRLFLLPAVFGNVHNLVLENKKVRGAFAGQAHHVLVVILDPATHRLTIH